jgi:hypothetical protein
MNRTEYYYAIRSTYLIMSHRSDSTVSLNLSLLSHFSILFMRATFWCLDSHILFDLKIVEAFVEDPGPWCVVSLSAVVVPYLPNTYTT